MSYNIIPVVVIIFCLGAIIAIIVRHLSELAAIDINSITNTGSSELRRRIIVSRLKNIIKGKTGKIMDMLGLFINKITQLNKSIRKKIVFLESYYESLYYKSIKLKRGEVSEKIKTLIEEAKVLTQNNQLDDAERKYLLAINLEPKNPELYEMLTHIYWDKKDYQNAIDTMRYLVELRQKLNAIKKSNTNGEETNRGYALLAAHYLDLGLIYQDAHKPKDAVNAFKNALLLQPNHPRYLGLLLDASIEAKDKKTAIKSLETLRMVNPDNQKIIYYQNMIDELNNMH